MSNDRQGSSTDTPGSGGRSVPDQSTRTPQNSPTKDPNVPAPQKGGPEGGSSQQGGGSTTEQTSSSTSKTTSGS